MVSSATRRADGLIDSSSGSVSKFNFFLTQTLKARFFTHRLEAKMKRHNLIEIYE